MSSNKIALGLFMLGALLPMLACGSARVCPPNEPIYKWKEIPVPYPIVLRFNLLPPLVLPEYPQHPGHDADEAELKAWSLEVKRVDGEREVMKDARIEALEEREKFLNDIENTVSVEDLIPPD